MTIETARAIRALVEAKYKLAAIVLKYPLDEYRMLAWGAADGIEAAAQTEAARIALVAGCDLYKAFPPSTTAPAPDMQRLGRYAISLSNACLRQASSEAKP